jgi:transcriptional regulator GlxA family with amidase domain
MEANLHRPLTVADIACHVGLSHSRFSDLFRIEVGASPARLLLRMRMQVARELLCTERALPLKEVAARVGVPRLDVFERGFHGCFGVAPGEFRRRR